MANSQSPLVGGGQTVNHQDVGMAATNTVSSAVHVLANEEKKDCYIKYAVHIVLVLDKSFDPSMPIATPRTKKPTQRRRKNNIGKSIAEYDSLGYLRRQKSTHMLSAITDFPKSYSLDAAPASLTLVRIPGKLFGDGAMGREHTVRCMLYFISGMGSEPLEYVLVNPRHPSLIIHTNISYYIWTIKRDQG